MKLRKSLITASIAAAVALGAMGQAQASIYGGAFLALNDFVITTTGVNDPALPIDFVFNLRNTADLNGTNTIETATCQGLVGTATDCNTGAGNTLDAAPAQVGTNQADNTYTYLGPGGDEYARGDSVILSAQLVDGTPSSTRNIAESELQTGNNASSSSDIQSVTGLTMVFEVNGPGTISLSFMADVDLLAAISDTDALIASAQASVSWQALLSHDNSGDSIQWNPTNVSANDVTCQDSIQSGAGVTCDTQTVAENLNTEVSVSTVPFSSDSYSRAPSADPGFGSYFAQFSFVEAGKYTLSLTENKQVQVTRFAVPEPTTLLLLGSGLIGMGIARRRARKA